MSARLIPLVLALSLQIASAAPTTAPALPQSQSDFMRLIDTGNTGSRLETADVAYRNADGVTVHLVSAVHVAELEARDSRSKPDHGVIRLRNVTKNQRDEIVQTMAAHALVPRKRDQ